MLFEKGMGYESLGVFLGGLRVYAAVGFFDMCFALLGEWREVWQVC
jgi:hypothetical protein